MKLTTWGRKGIDDGMSGISFDSSTPLSLKSFAIFIRCCTRNLLSYKNPNNIKQKSTKYIPSLLDIEDSRNSLDLFHEEKNLVPPAPYIVLNFLQLHLHKVLHHLRPFYDTKRAEKQKQQTNFIFIFFHRSNKPKN